MNEIWDITDAEGRPTGRTMKKGAPMRPGEYHLSVSIWIVNGRGEFLISRRIPGKKAAPGMWETTGGSALAGEDALTAALREVKEELGITLDPAKGHVFSRYTWPHSDGSGAACIVVWIFRQEAALSGLTLQREETCGAKWEGAAARPDPGRENDPVHLYRGIVPAYGKDGAECTVS